MTIKNAEFEDMKRLGHIMSVSFRTAFAGFISRETLDACAREENCAALLEEIFREGQMHYPARFPSFPAGCGWRQFLRPRLPSATPASRCRRPSGSAMLAEALKQIGEGTVFLWAFRENKRARRFYEKHGFRWDGTERISEFDGAVEVRYVRN